MAKKSMINREVRRVALAKKFGSRRLELKDVIKDEERSYEEREDARIKLQKLPRDSSPVDRPAARLLPQVRTRPQRIASPRDARARAGPGQGELVRAGRTAT
jgi:hypothetical protein